MTKGKISAMSWADLPFTGKETVEVIQGGKNVRIQLSDIISSGVDGKSAYELAVENGYSGNVTGWLASLVGATGQRGPEGVRGPKGDRGNDGVNGQDGTDGESAFEIYKRIKGWDGTETEWIEQILEGGDGSGEGGQDGTDGVDGADGESAYEIYKRVTGFEGSEEEYIEELRGPQGTDGESAFEIYKRVKGWSGTEEEWLDHILGSQDGGGDGGSGGDSSRIEPVIVRVTDWLGEGYIIPDGVTVEREYSDTSIKIHHNKGMFPTGWFGFNRESSPMTSMVPTSMRNMQIVDENTVIITSIGSVQIFDVIIHFS